MIVDVWVRVCSVTDVTRAGVEDVVEVEVDETVDEVVLDEVVLNEVVEVDLVILFKMEKLVAVISKWN